MNPFKLFSLINLYLLVIQQIKTNPVGFLGLENYIEAEKKKRNRVTRRSTTRKWFMTNGWGSLINSPDINQENSYSWKQFQAQFRLPPPLFFKFVDLCKDKKILCTERESKIPLEIKILIALRILEF